MTEWRFNRTRITARELGEGMCLRKPQAALRPVVVAVPRQEYL